MDVERAVEIVTAEALKKSVKILLEDRNELDVEEKHVLSSLLRVISYYSLKKDFDEYFAENKEDIEVAFGKSDVNDNYSFSVKSINENPDGSADIEVEASSLMREKILNEGINFLFIKGILNGTTEEVFCWAEKGKDLVKNTSDQTKPLDKHVQTIYE